MKKGIAIGLIIVGLILLSFPITFSALHEIKQTDLISEQKIIINQQVLRIENLERCCRWTKVLEQILPPISQAELDLMEEQVRQGKINKNKPN